MELIDYIIVSGSRQTISKNILEKANKGYELYGSPCMDHDIFFQPMILIELED